ncbi:MAG: glycoside hydrolase family 28 protein [Breznakibacter sp.]
MKRHWMFLLLFCLSFYVSSQNVDQAWKDGARMVKNLKVPTFKNRSYAITAYGASEKGSARENKKAINAAIDAASAKGGGKVVVPAGEWLTGPITLKSNVNLVVEAGAMLKFSTDYADYLPAVLTRWEGVDCYNLQPLIYAYGQHNIAITGKGVIDGQGSNEQWWYMKGRKEYGWKPGMLSQEEGGRAKLLDFDQRSVPVEERIMTLEDALRPQLINIYHCKNVLIEGVELRNSPFWVIHPLMVENLVVRQVRIDSHGPNSDGCDPESSRNILIEDCFFDTGDDCIAIKSGRNFDGRRWSKPSENIYVRNSRMKNGHGGVVIGSEISGGFRNLWVENCQMDSPELERVIRIKTSNCRGGIIENIYVRNIEVGECQEAVLKINLKYEPNEVCRREFPPVVRNVFVEEVNSKRSQFGVFIEGLDESVNVENVIVKNCNFEGVERGNSIRGAKDVKLVNLSINGKLVE